MKGLATMPEEQRNHVMEHGIDTPNGHKSLEEATTRELEDYKKRNKTLEQQNAQLQSQVEQAQRSSQLHVSNSKMNRIGSQK